MSSNMKIATQNNTRKVELNQTKNMLPRKLLIIISANMFNKHQSKVISVKNVDHLC